jgi:DNA-binding SARP family transcriptional activator
MIGSQDQPATHRPADESRSAASGAAFRLARGAAKGGLPIPRLDALIDAAWAHRLTLVIAPAGSGKTMLLSRFANRASVPIVWYRAEAWDREPPRLLKRLELAFSSSVDGLRRGWEAAEDAITALDALPSHPLLFIVDDLHRLEATEAESTLEAIFDHLPAHVTVACGTRVRPAMNLSRLLVSGELLEIGPDDLRFRAWEVERLFRVLYDERMPPEEIAVLARRTEGWPAGLHLFYLATRGKAPAYRQGLLEGLGPRSRLMSEYLSRNVLRDLPEELRDFLVNTSVMGRLTGELCDALLGRTGSQGVLEELEARCLFTVPLTEVGAYRYHEVFRAFLQGVLTDLRGSDGARACHHRAGELMAEAGALPEALDAFCRAGSWERVASLLGRDGVRMAQRPMSWADVIPPTILRQDPWLLLAQARAHRGQGRLQDAITTYSLAELACSVSAACMTANGVAATSRERLALVPWAERTPLARTDPSSRLRQATIHEPLRLSLAAGSGDDGVGPLVPGLALLLDGRPLAAIQALRPIADQERSGGAGAVAKLALGAAMLLAGEQSGANHVRAAISLAREERLEWLERLGQACLALADPSGDDALAVAASADRIGDAWGGLLARLLGALADGGTAAQAREPLEAAATAAEALGAPVLGAWARAMLAVCLVRTGDGAGPSAAQAAEEAAGSAAVSAAAWIARLASLGRGTQGIDPRDVARTSLREAGLRLPRWVDTPPDPPDPSPSASRSLDLRCFGFLTVLRDDVPIDLSALRPRVRSILRFLACQPGTPVHQELIQETFWPGADPVSAAQNLHASIAAIRRVLEPGASRGHFQVLMREGPTYRLALPEGSFVDVAEFDRSIASGRRAVREGDAAGVDRAYRAALALYRGDLLEDEGPADWLVEVRELRRQEGLEAVEAVAALLEEQKDYEEAARLCTRGLRIDRYHDPLWRRLIRVREQAGDEGAARRARDAYRQALEELGVEDVEPRREVSPTPAA